MPALWPFAEVCGSQIKTRAWKGAADPLGAYGGATLCKPAQVPLLCSRGTGTDKDWWPESRMSVLNSRKLPPDAWASKLQAPGGELPRDRDRQLRVTQDPPKPSPGGAPPSGAQVSLCSVRLGLPQPQRVRRVGTKQGRPPRPGV